MSEQSNNAVPLSSIQPGTMVCIQRIDGGRGMLSRLRDMGIVEGDNIRVLNNLKGSILVSSGNLRFAVGRGMSPRIYVTIVEGQ